MSAEDRAKFTLFRVFDVEHSSMSQRTSEKEQQKAAGLETWPTILCLASIAMTWAGLTVAATGVKWGVAPPPGDALPTAWQHVNIMLLLTIGVVWPAIAMRGRTLARRELLWQVAAVFTGAVPSVLVAAFVAGAGMQTVSATLAMQVGLAILLMGVIRARIAMAATLVAAWLLGGPIAAFIWRDLFPGRWDGWKCGVPTMVLGGTGSGFTGCWVLAGILAVAGIVVWCAGGEARVARALA